MKPDKVSIYDLFDKQRQYVVPLYQRQYVWTKDTQWLPLWQDIADKARSVQHEEARAAHFLGAIVTSQRQVFGNEMNSWEIIDGQQRLTTLQLVITAFKDVVQTVGEHQYDVEFRRLTQNEGVMKNPIERFKVWPTNVDRAPFEAVMGAGSVSELLRVYPGLRSPKKREVPRLAEAYAYFFHQFERFVAGGDEESVGTSSDRIRALFETLRRYLQIVNIELEAGDDPQVIFESLNGRGVPLLPSDLVRNFVFMRATKDRADLDNLYGRYWRSYDEWRKRGGEEPWWKQEERQGRINRPRLDLFLFHYLQYRLRREVSITHLFQEFRKWWDEDAGTAESALAEMQRYAEPFTAWIEPDRTDRTADFARWLKVLDTSTVYPVLFFVLVQNSEQLSDFERNGILDDIESYLVRRSICGLTNKQYNRFFLMLLRNIGQSSQLSRAMVRGYLAEGRGDSVRWPGDEEFGQAFVHRPVYKGLKREVTLATLKALDQALVTVKNEKIVLFSELSIEHVLPQSWEKHWPITDKSEEARERRDRLLHTFGNLALITQEFNTSLSNREFGRKKKEFGRIRAFS